MIKKDILIKAIKNTKEITQSIKFLLSARLKNTYFTRKSKMNFVDLIMFILNFAKKTLQIELDDFIEEVKNKDMTYTKQAFSKARQKISPWVFTHLFQENVKLFCTATDLSTYRGYHLLAVDGSTSELPINTKELRDYFGFAENEKKKIAMARVSGLYDIKNNVMIDAIIERYDIDERTLAIRYRFSNYCHLFSQVKLDRDHYKNVQILNLQQIISNKFSNCPSIPTIIKCRIPTIISISS